MVLGTRESHDVQSINWKTSGADGLGQIEPEVLRTREAAKEKQEAWLWKLRQSEG